eukprot:3935322-Rhodomonas_salina.1
MHVEVCDGGAVPGEEVAEGDGVGIEPTEGGGDEGEEGEGLGFRVVVVVDPVLSVVDSILEHPGLGIAPLLPASAAAFPDKRMG